MHGQGERTWPDGQRYVGQWRHDAMWGRGELLRASGEILRGSFKANALHGPGERVWPNGDRYVGQFCEGELEGEGTFFEKASGDVFEGHWLHGRLYGEGSVKRADGCAYLGEWVDGIPDGRGRETWPDGTYYEGPFKKHCAQGFGLKAFADGSWFEGTFKDGEFEGHGIFHWADGTEFEGLWHNSKIAGPGCHRFPTGTTVEGNFQDHGASGEGTKRWACGCVYTGMLLRNRIDRSGMLRWPDGRCYIGTFEDDAMHGQGTLVWSNEGGVCTYRGDFVQNLFEGSGRLEWSSGASYEGAFAGGLYHGQGTFTWPDQHGAYSGSWVRGEMSGAGTLQVGSLQASPPEAPAYEYVGAFSAGHMEGTGFVTFRTNGQIDQYEGDFKASRFCGRGTFTWGTGHQLQGLFEDNYCNRIGCKVYPDHRNYTGELRYDLEHGKGVMREPGGREFVGLWKDGEVIKELIMSGAPEFDLVGGRFPGLEELLAEAEGSEAAARSRSVSASGLMEPQASEPGAEEGRGADEGAPGVEVAMSPATSREDGARPPAIVTNLTNDDGEAEAMAPLGSGRRQRPSPSRKMLLPVIDEFGELAEGKTLVVFLNGDRYIGHMKEGRKHGRGMYVYADLVTYRGVWDMDVLDGVRHPVTEDVLPVEVRRLGPARQGQAPDLDEGDDASPTGTDMTPAMTCPPMMLHTGSSGSAGHGAMEATASGRRPMAVITGLAPPVPGEQEIFSPVYHYPSSRQRRSIKAAGGSVGRAGFNSSDISKEIILAAQESAAVTTSAAAVQKAERPPIAKRFSSTTATTMMLMSMTHSAGNESAS